MSDSELGVDKLTLAVVAGKSDNGRELAGNSAVEVFNWTALAEVINLIVLQKPESVSGDVDGVVLTSDFLQQHYGEYSLNPQLPAHVRHYLVESETTLQQTSVRESYVHRLLAARRFIARVMPAPSQSALMVFQRQHKYLIMAYSPENYKRLGHMAATPNAETGQPDLDGYFSLLMSTLSVAATRKGHTNSLMHLQGYFKKVLSGTEKGHLSQVIDDYRNERLSLGKVKDEFRSICRCYPIPYIEEQEYLRKLPDVLRTD